VLGSPISHSLSPTLHRAAYAALGLDWVYQAHDVDQAGLPGFLDSMGPEWRGLSLTMPLKRAAIGLCTRVSSQARLVGAVNTVLVEAPGELVGLNTDVPGFVAAWREAGIGDVGHAIVLGGGATARSAVAALAEIGATHVTVLARSPERAGAVVSLLSVLELDSEIGLLSNARRLPNVDLVVSTVPSMPDGSLDDLAEQLVARTAAVCDVVYHPRLTRFVTAARRSGLPCAEGLDLLVHQAALQVELMTGSASAPLERMRKAGLAELARRERES